MIYDTWYNTVVDGWKWLDNKISKIHTSYRHMASVTGKSQHRLAKVLDKPFSLRALAHSLNLEVSPFHRVYSKDGRCDLGCHGHKGLLFHSTTCLWAHCESGSGKLTAHPLLSSFEGPSNLNLAPAVTDSKSEIYYRIIYVMSCTYAYHMNMNYTR